MSLIFSSVLENQVNLCYQGKMLFLNMSDASLVFFGKIHSNYFSLLLVPYHAAKSEKIFYVDPVV